MLTAFVRLRLPVPVFAFFVERTYVALVLVAGSHAQTGFEQLLPNAGPGMGLEHLTRVPALEWSHAVLESRHGSLAHGQHWHLAQRFRFYEPQDPSIMLRRDFVSNERKV